MTLFSISLRKASCCEEIALQKDELLAFKDLAYDAFVNKLEELALTKKTNVAVRNSRGNLVFEILYAPKRSRGIWCMYPDSQRLKRFVKSFFRTHIAA